MDHKKDERNTKKPIHKRSFDLKERLERRRRRKRFKDITNKSLPEDFFQNVVEYENKILKEFTDKNIFELLNLYKKGVEYFSNHDQSMFIGFLNKFQQLISDKHVLRLLKSITLPQINQEIKYYENGYNSTNDEMMKCAVMPECDKKKKTNINFIWAIKKIDTCLEKNFDFINNTATLDYNFGHAEEIVEEELLDQNMNFLKNLQKKLYRKNKSDLLQIKFTRKNSIDRIVRLSFENDFIKNLTPVLRKEKSEMNLLSLEFDQSSFSSSMNLGYSNFNSERRKSCYDSNIKFPQENCKSKKKKLRRLSKRDRLAEIIDEFITGFIFNYRKIIKKTLMIFNNIIKKKFHEEINHFNSFDEQISYIKMMISDELNVTYSDSMKQMIASLERDDEIDLMKIRKDTHNLIMMLKLRAIKYFVENNKFVDELELELLNKISDLSI